MTGMMLAAAMLAAIPRPWTPVTASAASGWTLEDLETKFTFTPYDKMPECVPPSYVPTGCPEFEVELPRRTDGPVVKAVDFGLSEVRTDNAAVINRALAEAKRIGATRLELAPGTYKCHDAKGVMLEGFRDFTFDGRGATLVFCRPARVRTDVCQYDIDCDGADIMVKDCERTLVRNFNIDWDWEIDPLADFARCVAKHVDETNDNASYFDLKLTDLERHPKYPNPVPVQVVGQMREDRTNIAGDGWGCNAGFAEGHFGSRNEWIAPNVLRVWPCVKQPGAFESPWYDKLFTAQRNRTMVRNLPEGAFVRILHCYYGQNGVNMIANRHLTLDGVHIWACRGLGFQVQGAQHHWAILRCSVALPPHLKGKRAITSTADANHIVQSQGWCKFEDCDWSLHIDDMNNFHDRLSVGVKDGESAIRLVNTRSTGFFQVRPGELIGLLEADYAPVDWQGKVVRVDGETIHFDRPVPQERLECFQLFRADYATDNIIIRNCRFDDGFGRNLLQVRNLTVEDCIFRRTTGAPMCLMSEWTYNAWCEGCGVTNAVVRNCTFAENMIRNGDYDGIKADIFSGARIRATLEEHVPGRKVAAAIPQPDRKAVSGILVENCRFENPKGMCWHALRGDDLIFRNNTIAITKPDESNLPYRGAVLFEDAAGAHVSGNVVESTIPGADRVGVYLPRQRPRSFQGVHELRKLGTVDSFVVETTPVRFRGRTYLFEYIRWMNDRLRYRGNDTGRSYFRFRVFDDMRTVTPSFGAGLHLGSAFVWQDRVYVTAVEAWGGSRVVMLESDDLIHWTEPRPILNGKGWRCYNTTLCRADDRFVLSFEMDAPKDEVGEPYTMFFAESTDLRNWNRIDGAVMGQDRYTGAPLLRYHAGWFYFFHLEVDGRGGWEMRVSRSSDLKNWTFSPKAVLTYGPEDKLIHPLASFSEAERAEIEAAKDVNASDMDMCEVDGRLVVTYSWGDQNGHEFLALAEASCTEREFCEGFFKFGGDTPSGACEECYGKIKAEDAVP